MRLDDAVECRIQVAAGDEQPTVAQVSEARAEDVVARIDADIRVCARGRVIDGGPREGVVREFLGRGVPDGVPGQHLAVRKQRHVDPDDGPVVDLAPLPDLPGIFRDRSGGRLRRGGGKHAGVAVEPLLGRRAVDDLVLGLMARRGLEVVRLRDPRDGEPERQRQDEHSAQCGT